MSIMCHITFVALLGLAACDTAPVTVAPVTFTQMSAENLSLFEPMGNRGDWGAVTRVVGAEGKGIHRLSRTTPGYAETERTKLVRDCVLSWGGTVLVAERTTFEDGDVGLLVTCSK